MLMSSKLSFPFGLSTEILYTFLTSPSHLVSMKLNSVAKGYNPSVHPMAQQPRTGPSLLIVRFLDRAAGLLRRVISSSQSGQATAFSKFLIIPNLPTRVLWQLDQQTPSSEAGDWARNMSTQFCLQSVSTLVGFFYML
jgi:hypothetical protein